MVVPVLLVLGGVGSYKFGLSQAAPQAKHKVEGEVYVLSKDTWRTSMAAAWPSLRSRCLRARIISAPEPRARREPAEAAGRYGPLPQEAMVRHTATDTVTGLPRTELLFATPSAQDPWTSSRRPLTQGRGLGPHRRHRAVTPGPYGPDAGAERAYGDATSQIPAIARRSAMAQSMSKGRTSAGGVRGRGGTLRRDAGSRGISYGP